MIDTKGLKVAMKSNQPGMEARPPGDVIREELKKRGWTQGDLARILNRPLTRLNEIIQGKQGITPETAVALAAALDTSPELWLRLDSEYRLHVQNQAAFRLAGEKGDGAGVRRRKKLFEVAPIKELQKRGWIRTSDDSSFIEQDILNFFAISSLDEEPSLQAMMRKTAPHDELSPAQKAWCFRVRQLAKMQRVEEFIDHRLPQCEIELRKAAAYSQESRKVPTILASYGVRFVVVEPLLGNKIDGMATWLDTQSPVIGMSIRFDRLDAFWHTLFHELAHIRNRDEISIDMDMADPSNPLLAIRHPIERRADTEAAEALIPAVELESFIKRVSPLYSKERINQLANRLKIHPGIIVGQLQHRGEIGYSAHRESLVKVRHLVVTAALTDGWGNSIDSKVVQ